MAAEPVFLEHPASLAHDTGVHPERSARIVAIDAELERRQWLGYRRVLSPEVARETLHAVHPASYVAEVERAAMAGGGALDPDTVVSQGSFAAALHAAGGAVALVESLADAGAGARGFSSHRPPGHHALPARAMGFCLFNNVAVGARHALDGLGLTRLLVLDWDVHHGNGTNDIFSDEPRVLFISIHQSPLYPGSGPASDIGTGAGRGYNVNLPVPPGSGDPEFIALVEHVAVPLTLAYAPELVLISAGFDAHRDDPLADCNVTDRGYATMAATISEVADELGVGLGCLLEGGYDLGALARSVAATMQAIVDRPTGDAPGASADAAWPAAPSAEPADRGVVAARLVREARERLAPYWPAAFQ
jgi:acetoin utilization deacetylase AcuC-like enzyme